MCGIGTWVRKSPKSKDDDSYCIIIIILLDKMLYSETVKAESLIYYYVQIYIQYLHPKLAEMLAR